MRRSMLKLGILAMLLGGSAIAACAGPILVNTLAKGQDMLVTVSMKDADLVQALTTLFNKAGYQVKVDANVTGVVPNLQLKEEPFETALTKVLAAAGDYKFEKTGETAYKIINGDAGNIKAPALKSITAPDTVQAPVDDIKIIKVMLPKLKKINDNGQVEETKPAAGEGATEGEDAAETEECFIGLFTVYNLQLEGLCMMFGDDIAQYVPTQMINYGNMMNNQDGTNSGGFGSSFGSGFGNNNNNNWNSGYNNNNYNNGYNNNYNNGYNNNNYNNNFNNNNNNWNNNRTY